MKPVATFGLIAASAGLFVARATFPPIERSSAATPEPTLLDAVAEDGLESRDLNLALGLRAAAQAEFLGNDPHAHVRTVYPASVPDVEGGLPVVLYHFERPVVGSTFAIYWLSQYVSRGSLGNYVEGFAPPWRVPSPMALVGDRPDRTCALLVTLREPDEAAPIPGGRGGILQVPPDFVLVPDRLPALPTTRRPLPIDFAQDTAGKVRLWLTLPEQLRGLRVWVQLLMADDRVEAGCVPTPMVELTIGK